MALTAPPPNTTEIGRRKPLPCLPLLLTGIGTMYRWGSALSSRLLFDNSHTRALGDIGPEDTLRLSEETRLVLDL